MTQTYVSSEQRFKKWGAHCPICGGHSGLKQGKGERCAGYESDDGEYIFCTREELAGNLELNEKTSPATFCHKLYGLCNCGIIHNPAHESSNGNGNEHQSHTSKPVAYSYQDEHGRLAYQSLRYDPKEFKQRRPDGKGGWLWNMQGVSYVPYRLPDLLKNHDATVFIVEGEKDADNLARNGFVATTNVQGAGKWREEYNHYFKGRNVVILPDNDKAGKDHAQKVFASLTGVAASVKTVALPDLPDKGDVSDWITSGGTKEKLEEISRPPKRKFTYASEVQEQPIDWLWEGRLAKGEFTLGVGDAGTGKGLSVTKMIAHITRGLSFPGGPKFPPGGVILMSPEDSASRTIVPRLRAAGADLSKVLLLSEVDETDFKTDETYKRPVSFPEDANILREAIEDVGAVAVFIDPILSMISGKVDVYKNHAVRQALAQVMSTADKHKCAVFGVLHTTKGMHPNALFRSSSSTAFIEMARVALFFVPDPDGETDKSGVIVNYKNNLAERAASIRYAIHKTADNIGYITWEGMSTHTRDELLNQDTANNIHKSEQELDIDKVLRSSNVAMNVAAILEKTQSEKPDNLERMLRRKADQGLIWRVARGLYTYVGNPLYSTKENMSDMSDMSGSTETSETSETQNGHETDNVRNANNTKSASEAPLQETDISDIGNRDDMQETIRKYGQTHNFPRLSLSDGYVIPAGKTPWDGFLHFQNHKHEQAYRDIKSWEVQA
jgi:5S rRNA maturation endonuclease (ribonuclease M5)